MTGRVVTIAHPYVVLDGLVLDAAYGQGDAVRVTSAASHLVLRNLEIRRSGGDCVDLDAPADVLVERVLIHQCLHATGGRKDPHGVGASPRRPPVRCPGPAGRGSGPGGPAGADR